MILLRPRIDLHPKDSFSSNWLISFISEWLNPFDNTVIVLDTTNLKAHTLESNQSLVIVAWKILSYIFLFPLAFLAFQIKTSLETPLLEKFHFSSQYKPNQNSILDRLKKFQHPSVFQHPTCEQFTGSEDFMHSAIEIAGPCILSVADPAIASNPTIMKRFIEKHPEAIQWVHPDMPEMSYLDLLRTALEKAPNDVIAPREFTPEILLKIAQISPSLIPLKWKTRDAILHLLTQIHDEDNFSTVFSLIEEPLKSDATFFVSAIDSLKSSGQNQKILLELLSYANPGLKSDRNFIKQLINLESVLLSYADLESSILEELALQLCLQNVHVFQQLSLSLRSNSDFITSLLTNLWKWKSSDSRPMQPYIVSQSADPIFSHLDISLKTDLNFFKKVFEILCANNAQKKNRHIFAYVDPSWKKSDEFMTHLVTLHGDFLLHIPHDYTNYFKIALIAIDNSNLAMGFVPPDFPEYEKLNKFHAEKHKRQWGDDL